MTSYENIKRRAQLDAKAHGYFLTPNPDFLGNLIQGLKENEDRYGYPSCPCRLASGVFEWDRDIICPCDYREPDVEEFGQCFCALYVSKEVSEGIKSMQPIPERRPQEKIERALGKTPTEKSVKEETDKGHETKERHRPRKESRKRRGFFSKLKRFFWK